MKEKIEIKDLFQTIQVFAKSKDIAKGLKIKKNIFDEGETRHARTKPTNKLTSFEKMFENVSLAENLDNERCQFNVRSKGVTNTTRT